jgi:GTP-sensing pleiotropic transcriptional regulator CodY
MPRADKVLTKQEYADRIGVTRQTIMNWIYADDEILQELEAAGWINPFNRYWKPAEIKILDAFFKNRAKYKNQNSEDYE